MDEISIDEFEQRGGSTPAPQAGSEEISVDQFEAENAAHEQALEFTSVGEFEKANEEPGFLSKVGNFFDEMAAQRDAIPQISANFDTKNVNTLQANASIIDSAQQIWEGDSSKLSKVLTTLTLPEQLIARNAVNIMENVGMMDSDKAKALLSQEEVHGSDILNTYWKKPDSMLEKTARFGAGLLLDIVIDPLSYVGIGAFTKAGKTAVVAGKTLPNLDRAAKIERQMYKGMEKIERILDTTGNIVKAGPEADTAQVALNNLELLSQKTAQTDNLGLLGQFRDKKITFDQFQAGLKGVDDATKTKIKKTFEKSIGRESYFEQLANGERGITIGARIPFTNLAVEHDAFTVKWGGKQMQNLFEAAANIPGSDWLLRTKPVSVLRQRLKGLATKTGWGNYDSSVTGWLGDKSYTEFHTNQWKKRWYNEMGELTEQQVRDINQEIERTVVNRGETLRTWGKKAYMADRPTLKEDKLNLQNITEIVPKGKKTRIEQIATPIKPTPELEKLLDTPEDIARRQRMPKSHLKFAQEARQQLDAIGSEYKKRPGIPFEPLNPFGGKDWANNYLRHRLSKDWIKQYADSDKAAEAALDMIESISPSMVDKSTGARKFRGTINAINDKTLAEKGVKIFAEDPVELVALSMMDAKRTIRNHDLMESVIPHALVTEKAAKVAGSVPSTQHIRTPTVPKSADEIAEAAIPKIDPNHVPVGYVKFKIEDFANQALLKKTATGMVYDFYIPKFIRDNHKNMFLPESVYNDLLNKVGAHNYTGTAHLLMDAHDTFMKIFRNTALFGTGYLGMNAFSNMLTYLTAGAGSPQGLKKMLVDATGFFLPNGKQSFDIVVDGVKQSISRDELRDILMTKNIIRSGVNNELDFYHVAENIATSMPKRKSGPANWYDIAMLWSTNRAVAKYSDDIPKVAYFLDRINAGFTIDGAAEATEKFFYAFNNQGTTARKMGHVLPFSSFPVKTIERTLSELKSGHLGRLTIPGKVQHALEGAYVVDNDTREGLNSTLPKYLQRGMDKIHGPLLPGQREVLIETPWAQATMSFVWDFKQNIHPLIKIFGSWASSRDERVYDDITDSEHFWQNTGEVFDKFVPAYVRHAMAIAGINGWAGDFGRYFADKYSEKIPSTNDGVIAERFNNAAEFGAFMEKNAGEDWLYNLIFGNRIDPDDANPNEIMQTVERGNYVKKHFRDLTFGLATLTDMDKNFFINMGALTRQTQGLKASIEQELNKLGFLPNADKMSDMEFLEKQAETNPKIRKLVELEYKKEALTAYYKWYAGIEKEYPGGAPWTMLFKADEYKYDESERPDVTEIDIRKNREGVLRDIYENTKDLDPKEVITDPEPEVEEPEPVEDDGDYYE